MRLKRLLAGLCCLPPSRDFLPAGEAPAFEPGDDRYQ